MKGLCRRSHISPANSGAGRSGHAGNVHAPAGGGDALVMSGDFVISGEMHGEENE